MTERKFHNDYNIIVCAISLLLRQFQKEDNIFAAQCIWWLASIIRYTEISKFYLEYQIFPSDYIRDCVISPLPNQDMKERIFPDSDIPDLDLAEEVFAESLIAGSNRKQSRKQFKNDLFLNRTRSGKAFM